VLADLRIISCRATPLMYYCPFLLFLPAMNGDLRLYSILQSLGISFKYLEHPAAPTVEDALEYWKDLDATHCKNLFFRNHKGNRHYLVILEHQQALNIRDLELRLKQGKLTFGSPERLMKYLGVTPGSVTPFGLINDAEKHVHVFLDKNLEHCQSISFHPCINTASIAIAYSDFLKFLQYCGNSFEYVELYDL